MVRVYRMQVILLGNILSFLVSGLTKSPSQFSSEIFLRTVLLQVSLFVLAIAVLVGYTCWLQQEALVGLRARIMMGLLKLVSWAPQRTSSRRQQRNVVEVHMDSVLELRKAILVNQGQPYSFPS